MTHPCWRVNLHILLNKTSNLPNFFIICLLYLIYPYPILKRIFSKTTISFQFDIFFDFTISNFFINRKKLNKMFYVQNLYIKKKEETIFYFFSSYKKTQVNFQDEKIYHLKLIFLLRRKTQMKICSNHFGRNV